ncbi:MAG: hypothetical protein RQ745_05440 [Longimicrobiales bacterium]|nr:hypothetical protein [Longimicrobiales bacterium]
MTNNSPRERLDALEAAVEVLLDRLTSAERRAAISEERRTEVEVLLREMSAGSVDPAEMAERLQEVEAENEELRSRLDGGLERVERLLARVHYLEDQR